MLSEHTHTHTHEVVYIRRMSELTIKETKLNNV